MTTPPNPDALKHLFDRALLKRIATSIHAVHPAFDSKRFNALFSRLDALEMKPRVRMLRDELRVQLPPSYPQALKILLRSAQDGTLQGFDLWPYSEFIQTFGLDHPELSLRALRVLTPLFTSEFAVRPFLKTHPRLTLDFLRECALSESVDLRRWASEGTRPRLPWGERLQDFVADPSSTLPILEQLKFDPELYVRKSVSNHLNDIAKDHPEKVIALLRRWKKSAGTGHSKKVQWIIHRSLRTLIKAGNPGALELIGVSTDAKVKLQDLRVNRKEFKIGDRVEFAFQVQSLADQPQNLVIDYIVHFVRANQTRSPKVFKLKTGVIPAGARIEVLKSHPLKEITTRAHYPGTHWLDVQINGKVLGRLTWELLKSAKSR